MVVTALPPLSRKPTTGTPPTGPRLFGPSEPQFRGEDFGTPTIRKLMHATARGRDYSLATWGAWVCSNGFFALYLWEHGGRRLDAMVLINCGSTRMCLVTCYFIVKLHRRSRAGK